VTRVAGKKFLGALVILEGSLRMSGRSEAGRENYDCECHRKTAKN
jgi:hypothetical protein